MRSYVTCSSHSTGVTLSVLAGGRLHWANLHGLDAQVLAIGIQKCIFFVALRVIATHVSPYAWYVNGAHLGPICSNGSKQQGGVMEWPAGKDNAFCTCFGLSCELEDTGISICTYVRIYHHKS